ncbi:PAS domain S-box protein [Candidatus Oleimmundimicrobium sp.]|uniref:PAS domain S-box protein n=1 Tax=Candidatus Oleimmundimicrobium sp. TaxID=3060597 RepID=UPI0027215172|nr:PAS domain S-box protein [Candidatus Oleimmundimicrobium sp.]MDO8886657.1 PAS domain S-box protein [Candidatus Oleimmundimicrobium sp.]
MKEKNNQKEIISPFGLIWQLALVIFIVELLIMVILWKVPTLSKCVVPLLDAAMLIVLVIPAFYYLVYRPLTQEIIERRRTEKELFNAKTKLEATFQCAGGGIRAINTDYKIIDQNKEMDALCGVKEAEAVGKKCSEIFQGPYCGTDKCTFRQILAGAKRVDAEGKRVTKGGKPYRLISSLHHLKTKKEKLLVSLRVS